MAVASLIGRGRESDMIARLLVGAHERGGTLVLRGEPGIGKSALLRQASSIASDRGMLVLSTAGVQSETNLPFAGLHQLLRPVLALVDRLAPLQRNAVMAAFGVTDAGAPDPFLIAMAALELLSDAAARSPVTLIVEDAQWLDRPTTDALAFVGRRVESDPIVVLAGVRDGYDSALLEAGLPELHLDPLADEAAGELLDAHFPGLAPAVRTRVLEEGEGNPLALLELPAALGSGVRGGDEELPTRLPLTTRLEHAFASRAAELPSATRTLLRIAAVDDGGGLAEIISAAEIVAGVRPTVEALVPAVEVQLIDVDGSTVRFRHPLVRSAIHQAASVAERHGAHAALAEVLDDKDRRAWHRAAAAVGQDPTVASELEDAAERAQRRGGIVPAVAAFERAAALTAEPARRGALLLRSAALASELGRREMVRRLLREADSLELGSHDRARSMWLGDALHEGPAGDPARVHALVETAERMTADGQTDLALDLLTAAARRCYWADIGEHPRDEVLLAADHVGVAAEDPRLLQIQACVAPIERGAAVIECLPTSMRDADPGGLYLLGTTAYLVGAFDQSSSLLATAAARLREQGRLGLLTQVLVTRAWSAIFLAADLGVATPAAEEARKLAAETTQPLWQARAQVAQAMVAALRGEQSVVENLTAKAERFALPIGAAALLAVVQAARGLSALGQGRHAEAYDHLRRLSEPSDTAHHQMILCFAISNLAEAAAHSDHRDQARSVMRQLEPLARQTPSPWFHVGMLYARVLLADDEDAGALFEDALGRDLTSYPFMRARLQLAFGAWLRRQRRTAESRAPLRAARDAFDALGICPWAARARQELRASGESSRRRTPDTLDELTPQELQIVQMAAEGLSNREIGQRLYLSHRTVESHLYRVFPKLGVTSRAQLSRVLGNVIGPAA
jgi:DNA-binding CsgD family transcriptional regulator